MCNQCSTTLLIYIIAISCVCVQLAPIDDAVHSSTDPKKEVAKVASKPGADDRKQGINSAGLNSKKPETLSENNENTAIDNDKTSNNDDGNQPGPVVGIGENGETPDKAKDKDGDAADGEADSKEMKSLEKLQVGVPGDGPVERDPRLENEHDAQGLNGVGSSQNSPGTLGKEDTVGNSEKPEKQEEIEDAEKLGNKSIETSSSTGKLFKENLSNVKSASHSAVSGTTGEDQESKITTKEDSATANVDDGSKDAPGSPSKTLETEPSDVGLGKTGSKKTEPSYNGGTRTSPQVSDSGKGTEDDNAAKNSGDKNGELQDSHSKSVGKSDPAPDKSDEDTMQGVDDAGSEVSEKVEGDDELQDSHSKSVGKSDPAPDKSDEDAMQGVDVAGSKVSEKVEGDDESPDSHSKSVGKSDPAPDKSDEDAMQGVDDAGSKTLEKGVAKITDTEDVESLSDRIYEHPEKKPDLDAANVALEDFHDDDDEQPPIDVDIGGQSELVLSDGGVHDADITADNTFKGDDDEDDEPSYFDEDKDLDEDLDLDTEKDLSKDRIYPAQNRLNGPISFKKESMDEKSQSHFFGFLMTITFCTAAAYLLYHNKRKVTAVICSGAQRRTGTRQRGYKANYEKLETKPDSKNYVF